MGGRLQKAVARNPREALTGARVGPTGPTFSPLRVSFLRVTSRPFLSLMMIFSIADKFCCNYALESLFSTFLKFTLENTEYAKLVEIVR